MIYLCILLWYLGANGLAIMAAEGENDYPFETLEAIAILAWPAYIAAAIPIVFYDLALYSRR